MNQENNLKKFRDFIFNILKRKFKSTIERSNKLESISLLLFKSSPKLDGRIFYDVLIYLEEDIDETCKAYFNGHQATVLSSLTNSENLFFKLISPHINSQNQISDSSKINSKRFNRLFLGELQELYADEVFGLAIAFSLKPSQLFNYFYGDGERPVVGV